MNIFKAIIARNVYNYVWSVLFERKCLTNESDIELIKTSSVELENRKDELIPHIQIKVLDPIIELDGIYIVIQSIHQVKFSINKGPGSQTADHLCHNNH